MNVALRSLKKRLINQAVAEPIFEQALAEAASEIVDLSRTAVNEATIESIFERTLYATLKEIGLKFHPAPSADSPLTLERQRSL